MAKLVTDPALIGQLDALAARPQAQPKAVTDPELIKQLDAQSGASPQAMPWGQWTKGMIRAAAKGATFNWGDEIEAGVRGLAGEDRERALAQIRDEMDGFAKENPKSALAMELAAAVAVPGLGTMKAIGTVMKAAPLAGRALVGATVGGAEGAVAGAGEAETADEMGDKALSSAGFSAFVGGALPVAGRILKSTGRAAATAIPESTPVLGRMTQGVKDRVALENYDEALSRDAALTGRDRGTHLADLRTQLASDRLAANGTGQASLLSVADDTKIGGERVGLNVAALAKNTARRSPESRAIIKGHARDAENALPGGAEYDALYARGLAPPTEARQIGRLMTQSRTLRRVENEAREELQTAGVRPPARGEYDPRLLDYIDRRLIRMKTETEGGGSDTIEGARKMLNGLGSAAFPANAASDSLENIKRKVGIGNDQMRKAQAATKSDAEDESTRRLVDDLARSGSLAMSGGTRLMATSIARAALRFTRGDLDKGEALARILVQKTGRRGTPDEAAMQRIIGQLENMNASKRTRYIDALIGVSAQQIGANQTDSSK